MKKFLALLLCLCLVVGAVVCLASCKKGGDDNKVSVDLTDYKVIYESAYKSSLMLNWAKGISKTITSNTGLKISHATEKSNAVEKEILVGHTNREESGALLAKIEGEGYAYGVVNGKIVLVGTSNLMTVMAAESFLQNCVVNASGATVEIAETVVSNAETVDITSSYSVIYSDLWDDSKNTGNRLPSSEFNDDEDEFTNRDHGVVMAEHVRNALKNAIKATSSTALKFTSDKKEASNREVLVGLVNRDSTKQFIKTIGVDGFGIALYGQNLIVTGLNDNGLRQAVDMFEQLAEMCAITNEEGKRVVRLPAGFRMTCTKDFGWELDVPLPEGEGIDLSGSVDVGEGSVEFYYTGTGVNADAFNKYCSTLQGAGFTLLQENTLEGSIFRTYRNDSTQVLLYTAYADYKYAFEQGVKLYNKCIRVVTGSTTDDGNNFTADLFQPAYREYTKLTDTRLTPVRLNYVAEGSVYGNLYVMQLEDGSFIVQDGGFVNGDSVTRLYNVLSDLYRQATGTSPSTANPIVIAAWYLSHGHGDHTGNFLKLAQSYGKTLRIEKLIGNMPSSLESYNCGDPNLYVSQNLTTIINYTQCKTQYLKVHTGQVLYLRNVEIEVLYTHDDIYPQTFERFNNSTTVLRTHIHNTDGAGNVQGKTTSILWLGDLMTRGSACLRAMYGNYLKTEVVQVAHHGGSGCEKELYDLTQARVLLWPHSADRVSKMSSNNTGKPGSSTYVSYNLCRMESVEYIFVSDIYNTTITITKDGMNLGIGGANGLYNAGEPAAVKIATTFGSNCAVIKLK